MSIIRQLLTVVMAGMVFFSVAVAEAKGPKGNIVEECLAIEAKAERDGTACIGRLADACLEKPLGTHGQVKCIRRELVLWDKILNREYLILRTALDDEQKAKLKEAQRTWIRLRDQDCYLPHVFYRGTMAQPIGAYCSMKRTAQRALFLRKWRENKGGFSMRMKRSEK